MDQKPSKTFKNAPKTMNNHQTFMNREVGRPPGLRRLCGEGAEPDGRTEPALHGTGRQVLSGVLRFQMARIEARRSYSSVVLAAWGQASWRSTRKERRPRPEHRALKGLRARRRVDGA